MPLSFGLQFFPASGSFPISRALHIWWPKYLSFSNSPSNEYSELISLRIDWFYLLAVQETLKSLLQNHNSKTSIIQYSAFYGPAVTSIHDQWKNHSFDYMNLCWQSLLFNMMSGFIIAFFEEASVF